MSGPPCAAFPSALASSSLDRIRRTARQLPEVRLKDAVAICVAYHQEPDLYERAAMRWLGPFCLEAEEPRSRDVYQVAEALERLPTAQTRPLRGTREADLAPLTRGCSRPGSPP